MSSYNIDGYVRVAWTNASRDAEFYSWRVYRRAVGGSWEQLSEVFEDQADYEYRDYFARSGGSYQYAVVQVAARFGAFVESEYVASDTVVPLGEDYWLLDNVDSTNNIRLHHVTADEFTDEYEEEILPLIGKGKKIDRGTYYGKSGSMTATFRDVEGGKTAREQRLELELLKAVGGDVYLRGPFGDLWLVSLGNIGFSRMAGVGNREYGTASIPYQEVS